MKILILLTTLTAILACSGESTEQIDRRSSPAQGAAPSDSNDLNTDEGASDSGPNDSVVEDQPINFSAVTLSLAANSDQLAADFLTGVRLTSKVDATSIVLFGSDGTSWLYASDGTSPPQEIVPIIAPPEDRILLTMDQDDFWLVDAARVSKRKFDPEAAPGDVVLINFDLTKLSGDKTQLRILGATHESLLLFLGSHVAIFSVKDGVSSAYEFNSTLPSATGSEIISAGDMADGGYWFATQTEFVTLRQKDGQWVWNTVALSLSTSSAFASIAARLDFSKQAVDGDLLLIANEVYSVSGSPIAAAP